MKNNILYINLDFKNYKNKTLAQLKAFNNIGLETYLLSLEQIGDNTYDLVFYKYIDKRLKEVKRYFTIVGERMSYKFNNVIKTYILEIFEDYKFEYIYIRRMDIMIVFYYKLLKYVHKYSKVIYELPTYPFDKVKNIKKVILQKVEMIVFNLLIKKYIDIIPIIKQKDVKIDKKMIEIFNGVDVDKYSNKVDMNRNINIRQINFIGIAHVNYWHGYDRFIKSMKEYSGNKIIKFTIISNETEEIKKLKNLVKKLDLENAVEFINHMEIENIIEQLNLYNIGVGGISYHRRGAVLDTSIKNKEYCLFGLPFIIECEDKAFKKDFNYLYKVEENESLINISDIIDWYFNVYNENTVKDMQKYAADNLTFDVQIKKIINKLK